MTQTQDQQLSQEERDRHWMSQALALARQAAREGEVPVGALVVDSGNRLIGEGWNQPIGSRDPTAHAEIVALRQAARALGNYRLPGATLYVTVEPCSMCAGALIHSRIERLVIATPEPKAGAVISQLRLLDGEHNNHRISYTIGVLQQEASELMSDFFRDRRAARR